MGVWTLSTVLYSSGLLIQPLVSGSCYYQYKHQYQYQSVVVLVYHMLCMWLWYEGFSIQTLFLECCYNIIAAQYSIMLVVTKAHFVNGVVN